MKKITMIAVMGMFLILSLKAEMKMSFDFSKQKGTSMAGWRQNKKAILKPFGSVKVENSVATIESTTKRTIVYSIKTFPVVAGETLEIDMEISGKGTALIGFYCLDKNNKYITSLHQKQEIPCEIKNEKCKLVIKENTKGTIANGRLILTVFPNSILNITKISVKSVK